jgi:hypothetical protein
MKNTIKMLAIVVAGIACANSASAQSVSATADATGTIVQPLTITKTTDMQFGNMAVTATAGTVVMTAASGAGGRSATGGVTLPSNAGTVSAASFHITGQAGDTYSITIPSAAATLSDGAGTPHTMTLDTWTASPAAGSHTGTLSGGGTDDVYVGATLHIAGSQTPGTYRLSSTGGSGVFTVTVSY